MNHKLYLRMKMLPRDEVTSTFVAYQRSENDKAAKGRNAMADQGYEETDHAGRLLPDGREVIEMWGRKWVLRQEAHAERQALALERARARDAAKAAAASSEPAETRSVVGTESLSTTVCPKCGDSLQHTAVCTKCDAWRRGYRHRYACVCGAIEIISRDAL